MFEINTTSPTWVTIETEVKAEIGRLTSELLQRQGHSPADDRIRGQVSALNWVLALAERDTPLSRIETGSTHV